MTAIKRNQAFRKLYSAKLVCAAMLPFLLVGREQLSAELSINVQKDIAVTRKILQSWESEGKLSEERVLHVIVWRCRDRDFPSGYRHRLQQIMLHIQDFYRKEMVRHGLGRRSFNLDMQPGGEIVIHEVVGDGNWRDYKKSD
jgi:hypothetical protein